MANAQLGASERTIVIINADTKRILGFCPEYAKPLIPKGLRVIRETCNTAREIENWAKRFRAEQQEDCEEGTYRMVMREAPVRSALRDALIARSAHLQPAERGLNMALLNLMDARYRQVMDARNKRERFLLSEAKEADVRPEDMALESPLMKAGQ